MRKVIVAIIAVLAALWAFSTAAMAATVDYDRQEYARVLEVMTDEEVDELCRVLFLECRGESFEGKVACVETIFNRVMSENFPDSVHEVLSEPGQFSTWKRIDTAYDVDESNISVQQGEICRAIMYVYDNGLTVLPSSKYVYFDTRGINGREHIRIDHQYFGKEK